MQVQELVGIVPWTFIAQICNLFIQMYLIKRFLFKPINEMLEKRRAAADAEITDAEASMKSKARSAALPWILPERSLNVRLMKKTMRS